MGRARFAGRGADRRGGVAALETLMPVALRELRNLLQGSAASVGGPSPR